MRVLAAVGWTLATAAAILTFVACLLVTTAVVLHVALNLMGSE